MGETQTWLEMAFPAGGAVVQYKDEATGEWRIVIEGVGAPPPLTTEAQLVTTVREDGVLVVEGVRYGQ